jgi:hypothetical protein
LDDTLACRGCGRIKPRSEFDVRADTGRPRSRCKDCRRAAQNARNARLHAPREPEPVRVAGTTELLRCTRCGELKPAAEFPPVRRGEARLQTWCRACFAQVQKATYSNETESRARTLTRVARRREQLKAWLSEFVDAHPCACGTTDPRRIRIIQQDGVATTLGRLVASGTSRRRVEELFARSTISCTSCRRPATVAASPKRRRTTPRGGSTRRCSRCGVEKPIAEFPPKYRDAPKPASWCRECRAGYHAEWYALNRDEVIARVAANRERPPQNRTVRFLEVRRLRWEFLLAHPCIDCGCADPMVLQFDHRSEKVTEVSRLLQSSADWTEVLAEIEKCDVRCANCHRRKTALTIGYYRDLLDPVSRATAPEARRSRWEYLLSHPCVDCGESDPLVLEFDHRSGKRAAISDLMRNHASWQVISAEIAKCDVRCANCHKRRTAQIFGHYFELVGGSNDRVSEAA